MDPVKPGRGGRHSLLAYGGGAGVVVLLLAVFLSTSASPYRFVSEALADPAARNQTVYVAAFIANGSLQRAGEVTTLTATDGLATMPVVYRGPLPGILREDAGITLIGRMGQDGTFTAYQLLAKCPSKYEDVIRSRLSPT